MATLIKVSSLGVQLPVQDSIYTPGFSGLDKLGTFNLTFISLIDLYYEDNQFFNAFLILPKLDLYFFNYIDFSKYKSGPKSLSIFLKYYR